MEFKTKLKSENDYFDITEENVEKILSVMVCFIYHNQGSYAAKKVLSNQLQIIEKTDEEEQTKRKGMQ